MLTEERQEKILMALKSKGIVKVRDLIIDLDVSESTIRRDLQEMEEAGILKRVHGGAKLREIIKLESELNMQEKSTKNIQEKKAIARYAASLVEDGEVIYLDAGTTTYDMLPLLQGKKVHVMTNSVYHASLAADLGIMVTMIGGTIRPTTKAAVSSQSISQVTMTYFDKAFMGVNGIHEEYGYTTADLEEAGMKQAAMKQAQQVFVLGDSSKFDKVNAAKISGIEVATLITDQLPVGMGDTYRTLTQVEEVNA